MRRAVNTDLAQSYADENGLLFMETSAKTAANVNELFVAIAKKLPKAPPKPSPATLSVQPVTNEKNKQKKSGCCG